MALGGMIYIPSFMTIGSGFQVILRLLPKKVERLQCWHDVQVYRKFNKDWYRHSSNIKVLSQKSERL
jgi:hypothetical protein